MSTISPVEHTKSPSPTLPRKREREQKAVRSCKLKRQFTDDT
jgi:hypothetical protein